MKQKFWKQENWRSFWVAFGLTILVMVPGMAAVWAASSMNKEPAAESKSGIPIRLPDENHQTTILAVVVDEDPAFMLVRLDAVNEAFFLGAIPAESVVRAGAENQTVGECYAAAGPARVTRLLTDTLGIPIDRYVAATPDTWQDILEDAGTVRVGLNGALTEAQRKEAGLAEDAESWTVTGAHRFLQHLTQMNSALLPPPTVALARATLWQGWARQKLDLLPALLPEGLKHYSDKLLTDLTGTELISLEQNLEFLSNSEMQPESGVLPGKWNGETHRYEFNEETLGWLQASFKSAASAGAADSDKEP